MGLIAIFIAMVGFILGVTLDSVPLVILTGVVYSMWYITKESDDIQALINRRFDEIELKLNIADIELDQTSDSEEKK